MRLIKRAILMVLTALALSSCSSCPTQGKAAPIDRPVTPFYPVVFGHELSCLTDDVYKRLNIGKTMCRKRVKTYEKAIDKYNESIK